MAEQDPNAKLEKPWLIAVWPGMGQVALAAGRYLVESLPVTPLALLEARRHFDLEGARIRDGLVQAPEFPQNQFYGWKAPAGQRDLLIFIGERQPSVGAYEFCQQILAVADEYDVQRIVTFASMVTNLRLYIGDDFNTVEATPPADSGLASPFFPPCSLFAPEKRYGAEYDPYELKLRGQLGSLAGGRDSSAQSVHLLDLKTATENDVGHDKIEVNLSPIEHPAALPPVMMMNWLVVLEERRTEHYESGSNGTPQ